MPQFATLLTEAWPHCGGPPQKMTGGPIADEVVNDFWPSADWPSTSSGGRQMLAALGSFPTSRSKLATAFLGEDAQVPFTPVRPPTSAAPRNLAGFLDAATPGQPRVGSRTHACQHSTAFNKESTEVADEAAAADDAMEHASTEEDVETKASRAEEELEELEEATDNGEWIVVGLGLVCGPILVGGAVWSLMQYKRWLRFKETLGRSYVSVLSSQQPQQPSSAESATDPANSANA
mmetsp:Transcript_41690/g.89510  ORF Transcript_41690/g.89510 Transcript_41690/m.89510 type:complete len:235 (-) Transcript_41690:97-801(-)